MTQFEEWAAKNPFEAKMAGADLLVKEHAALRTQLERQLEKIAAAAPPVIPAETLAKLTEADAQIRKLLT